MANSIQESIYSAIDTLVENRINALKLDKTVLCTIESSLGTKGGRTLYKVKYAGGYFTAMAQYENDNYLRGMAVYVIIPQNDMTKDKIILGRASSINSSHYANTVSAVAANYTPLGGNLLTLKDGKTSSDSVGLYSYHSAASETTTDNHPVTHRYQYVYHSTLDPKDELYNFNNTELNTYKGEVTALLLRANFKAMLTAVQRNRPQASYGLHLALVFDNVNKGYGETRVEVFNYFQEKISATLEDGTQTNLKQLRNKIETFINANTTITTERRTQMAIYIDEVTELQRVFKANHPKDYLPVVEDLFKLYLLLLEDFTKYSNTKTYREDNYEKWMNTNVGQPSEITQDYYFSSDDMIGNPLTFTNWSNQYCIFSLDMTNFKRVESIGFYKQGFYENTNDEELKGADLFVKDVTLVALRDFEAQDANYALKVNPTTTPVFADYWDVTKGEEPTLSFQAEIMRHQLDDITEQASYYWYRQDMTVTSAAHPRYSIWGGIGWRQLGSMDKSAKSAFTTSYTENYTYKNNYRCVAVYIPEEGETVALRYDFSVYNNNYKTNIELVSDIGTNFAFGAGVPTVTVKIEEDEKDGPIEISGNENKRDSGISDYSENNLKYQYTWAIVDGNNQRYIVDNEKANLSAGVVNFQNSLAKDSVLKNIELYDGEKQLSEVNYSASRVKYPVSNLIGTAADQVTIECYIKKYNSDTNTYRNYGEATLTIENKETEDILSDYRIWIENGDQVFQYDEYGNTPTSNKKKDPLEILPLVAHLYNPAGVEIQDTNYYTEWYFPIENTLIRTGTEITLTQDPATELVNVYAGRQCVIDIQELYNPGAINNQLRCKIVFGNKEVFANTNFLFTKIGENGTNGTDVVVKIIPRLQEQKASILDYQPLTLYTNNTNIIQFNDGTSNVSIAGDNTTSALISQIYQKNQIITPDATQWYISGSPTAHSNTNGKWLAFDSSSPYLLRWVRGTDKDKQNYSLFTIKVEHQVGFGDNTKTYYGFYNLPIIDYKTNNIPVANSQRIAIDNAYYLKDITYNADGRNPIYNHNQGLKILNLQEGDTVTYTARGGFTKDVHGNITQIENQPCFSLLLDKNSDAGQVVLKNRTENQVYVLPTDMYSGSITNNYIQVEIKRNENLLAVIYAPINMTLNTFGLASLNAWDGNTVTIDEEGGYIMAPQIGAGEKDTNNRFTGILMGKTETYTGGAQAEKEIGLFGYSKGLQSIFLDAETGNATFGLPDVTKIPNDDGTITYKYNKKDRTTVDDYAEGRIELRPGDVSKIGGWRIGRRSLFYTLNSDETYNGTLGDKYKNDLDTPIINNQHAQYGEHHEHDIAHPNYGLLLSANPPYISVKGKILEKDEVSSSLNSRLREGDALEIQLDPATPTLFTIFRHNGDNRSEELQKKRTYMAGINDKGELLANAVGTQEHGNGTTFGLQLIKAFKDTHDDEEGSYIGANFEAGGSIGSTLAFMEMFVNRTDANNSAGHVYITGGQASSSGELTDSADKDEYQRPFSFHANDFSFYARASKANEEGQYDDPTTDNCLKLSKDNFSYQLGEYSYFKTNKDSNRDNSPASKFYIYNGILLGEKTYSTVENEDGTTTDKENINFNGPIEFYNQQLIGQVQLPTTKVNQWTSDKALGDNAAISTDVLNGNVYLRTKSGGIDHSTIDGNYTIARYKKQGETNKLMNKMYLYENQAIFGIPTKNKDMESDEQPKQPNQYQQLSEGAELQLSRTDTNILKTKGSIDIETDQIVSIRAHQAGDTAGDAGIYLGVKDTGDTSNDAHTVFLKMHASANDWPNKNNADNTSDLINLQAGELGTFSIGPGKKPGYNSGAYKGGNFVQDSSGLQSQRLGINVPWLYLNGTMHPTDAPYVNEEYQGLSLKAEGNISALNLKLGDAPMKTANPENSKEKGGVLSVKSINVDNDAQSVHFNNTTFYANKNEDANYYVTGDDLKTVIEEVMKRIRTAQITANNAQTNLNNFINNTYNVHHHYFYGTKTGTASGNVTGQFTHNTRSVSFDATGGKLGHTTGSYTGKSSPVTSYTYHGSTTPEENNTKLDVIIEGANTPFSQDVEVTISGNTGTPIYS